MNRKNWKLNPTWQFWAILAFGYLLGGAHAVLVFFAIMMAILALNIVAIFLMVEVRSSFVEKQLIYPDSWIVRWLCSYRSHTRGAVTVELPVTDHEKSFLHPWSKTIAQRVGTSHCVYCKKELFLQSFVCLDKDGVLYWSEMDPQAYAEYHAGNITSAE